MSIQRAPVGRCATPGLRARPPPDPSHRGVTFLNGRKSDISIWWTHYASQFCLVHVDCDLYEPAKAGLEFFYPRLAPGSLLIVHDYANPRWNGIKRAVASTFVRYPKGP